MTHPANKLKNLRRRVNHARNFPMNTCGASRHVHTIADHLSSGEPCPMLWEEPDHVAGSLYSVLDSLWKARTEIRRLKTKLGIDVDEENHKRIQKAVQDFERRQST